MSDLYPGAGRSIKPQSCAPSEIEPGTLCGEFLRGSQREGCKSRWSRTPDWLAGAPGVSNRRETTRGFHVCPPGGLHQLVMPIGGATQRRRRVVGQCHDGEDRRPWMRDDPDSATEKRAGVDVALRGLRVGYRRRSADLLPCSSPASVSLRLGETSPSTMSWCSKPCMWEPALKRGTMGKLLVTHANGPTPKSRLRRAKNPSSDSASGRSNSGPLVAKGHHLHWCLYPLRASPTQAAAARRSGPQPERVTFALLLLDKAVAQTLDGGSAPSNGVISPPGWAGLPVGPWLTIALADEAWNRFMRQLSATSV